MVRSVTNGGTPVLEKMAEFALKEAKGRGADFCTFVGLEGRTLRNRVIDGAVRQPKEIEDAGVQIVIWKNGRVMTQDVYPREDQISSAISYMIEVLTREEFPETDLLPPEGPYIGGYDKELVARSFDAEAAGLSREKSVEHIRMVAEALEDAGLILDAVHTQGVGTTLIATTHGTWQKHTATSAGFSAYAFDRKEAMKFGAARMTSAFAYSGGHRFSDINPDKMVRELVTKYRLQKGAVKWNPYERFPNFTGEQYFDLIAEPPFIGPILTWLFAYGGFNGKFFLQGESFLSGKLGEQVFGENITIWDDPYHPKGTIDPFDWEGVPKKKILLAERGVIKNICYDTTLAKKAGASSTGHAIPASAALVWGPQPENVYVEGGDKTVEDMIRDSKYPTIWVTKVHYMGMKHFQTGTITGTCQHGVFLVGNGEVICPVENLRFEMVMPEALRRVTHLGKPELIGGVLGGESPYVVPPMRIEGFRFIGATARTK